MAQVNKDPNTTFQSTGSWERMLQVGWLLRCHLAQERETWFSCAARHSLASCSAQRCGHGISSICRKATPIPFFLPTAPRPSRPSSAIHVLAFSSHAARPRQDSLDTCENASASDPPMQYHLPVQQQTIEPRLGKRRSREKSEKSMMLDIRTPNALPDCCAG